MFEQSKQQEKSVISGRTSSKNKASQDTELYMSYLKRKMTAPVQMFVDEEQEKQLKSIFPKVAAEDKNIQMKNDNASIQLFEDNPLKDMKIRKNRASNLGPGKVRNNGTKYHGGHDLQGDIGDEILSIKDGVVVKVGNSPSGYGNYITIMHTKVLYRIEEYEDGNKKEVPANRIITYSFYAHLDKIDVKKDDKVTEGQKIGEMGISGNAMGMSGDDVHLHFEYGTEIKSNGIIRKEARLDPNKAYEDVSFRSADSNSNQSLTGVIRTNYDDEGEIESEIKYNYNSNKSKLLYPLPDKYSKNQY